MMERYYTLREVADMVRVNVRTLRRRVEGGELVTTQVSERCHRVSETELRRFLAGRTQPVNPFALAEKRQQRRKRVPERMNGAVA